MARINYVSNRIIDSNGISDGASIYVYDAGTTTPITIYSDAGFTTPVSNPYVVPTGAPVPPLYHNNTGAIRVRIINSTGGVVLDDDPYIPIGSYIRPETGAVARSLEDKALDTISAGDFGGANDTAALNAAIAAAAEAGAGASSTGPRHQCYCRGCQGLQRKDGGSCQ